MRTVAVYPGRFHPFSSGHKAVYDHLAADPNIDDVYVVTSAKQNDTDSPFSYADKVDMMTKMGVPSSHIIQVKNPYKIDEIIQRLNLDPEQDRLIYALGSDDANRFKYTKDSPLQLLTDQLKMKPVSQHAYVKIIPQIPYNILGKQLTHASEIRKMYLDGNDADRDQIIHDLYGVVDPALRAMFDQRLGANEPQEAVIYGKERRYAGDAPVKVMRERREQLIKRITEMREQLAQFRRLNLNEQIIVDYMDEKKTRKK
jgi:Cytidylyltransferase-like